MFYKMGTAAALQALGLLKASQNPPPKQPAPQPKQPPPPPPKTPPIMGGGTKQIKTLRGEGVFL